MLPTVLAGIGLGLSLIVAIGAQNLFVLRQGLRRDHVLVVAAICTLSDIALIAVGVSGVGLVLQAAPWLVEAARWAGALFLLGYAALAARRALRPGGEALAVTAVDDAADMTAPGPAGRGAVLTRSRLLPVVVTCLALTWLNPHVYLDTVFLLGSVASTHGDDRWWFALGTAIASALWFFSLAYGARYLGRWLAAPRAWRVLDGAIAVIMTGIAAGLILGA